MAFPVGHGAAASTTVPPASAGYGDALLDRVLAAGPPAMLYQPVVDLTNPRLPAVGFEALARWPGLEGVTTAELFAHATRSDRMVELDWICRTAAIRGAMYAGIDQGTALFVNVEPAASVTTAPRAALKLWRSAAETLTMVLEVTERRILTDPSALLATTAEAREAGWWVALDDIGVNPDSLALLEFVRPDMVKLDLGFMHGDLDADATRTLRAVSAYCERTGALILAEGIEDAQQLERAVGLGASLGQGYLFGRPGQLQPGGATFHAQRVPQIAAAETPYELISSERGYRVARASVLTQLASDVVGQVEALADPPVCLVAIDPRDPDAAARVAQWSQYAQRSPLVALFGRGMPRQPGYGAHGTDLPADDPLAHEWALVLVGAHSALAIGARSLDPELGGDTRFRYAMTQDRDLVIAAGISMLNRLVEAEAHTG
ncbi:sensor domain-containing phosphodiesterase [Jatrophihabitans fulvus]